ncbi:DUF4397 domain-containing protein [Blastococcus sp. SYSU D00820]
MNRIARVLAVALLGGGLAAVPLGSAQAADGGLLRLAHLSPDTPAVDVYVDSVSDPAAGLTFPAVGYGTVSDYQAVPPGSYAISMRPAGADPATPPVLSTTVQVAADQARTVAGVGPFADLGLEVLEDDLTPPPPGSARVRVVAAASGAPTIDVALADGTAIADGAAFADTTDYVDVPAGGTGLRVTPAGGTPADLPVQVEAGSVYSVLVLDSPGGGLTVQTALDAASPGVVPVGGVEAGAGGTAGDASGDAVLPTVLTAGGVTLLAGGVLFAVVSGAARRAPRARHARRP